MGNRWRTYEVMSHGVEFSPWLVAPCEGFLSDEVWETWRGEDREDDEAQHVDECDACVFIFFFCCCFCFCCLSCFILDLRLHLCKRDIVFWISDLFNARSKVWCWWRGCRHLEWYWRWCWRWWWWFLTMKFYAWWQLAAANINDRQLSSLLAFLLLSGPFGLLLCFLFNSTRHLLSDRAGNKQADRQTDRWLFLNYFPRFAVPAGCNRSLIPYVRHCWRR